eukprot:CAMPEP_0174301604 /NCGR_PEP_ID=MMETSP0809-20121228/59146_1 /TAXON_ID=73025 ORGANISM="Eutreptiella gymnastica-like, Strain CCMP1594" /NCGR_SAMPLE_ID=MMETSP0809 /ASSEMBLY_ACC=CAM_ASM_000658 /LENGTH=101 /DNA_ID=CAMNT_0015407383 /DNA_START=728 /DNA_END=1030 /DNA_ORIENTATION=-
MPQNPERGTKLEVAHKWAAWLHNPAVWGVPTTPEQGTKSEGKAHQENWLVSDLQDQRYLSVTKNETRGNQHKAQEESGSSVAYKTRGTFLSQRMRHEGELW